MQNKATNEENVKDASKAKTEKRHQVETMHKMLNLQGVLELLRRKNVATVLSYLDCRDCQGWIKCK